MPEKIRLFRRAAIAWPRVSARGPGGARIFGAARSRRAQTEGGAQGAGPIQCGKRNGLPHVIIKKSSDSLAAALCFGPVARNIWAHPPRPQGLGGMGDGAEVGPPPRQLGVAGGFRAEIHTLLTLGVVAVIVVLVDGEHRGRHVDDWKFRV